MKLLVSVANVREALAAVAGGADIIDVKNPAEGSLGAGFPAVIRAVRAETPGRLAVSAALGDAPGLPGTFSLAAAGAAAAGADLVKVGLYGIGNAEEAIYFMKRIKEAVTLFNPRCRVIAAGYADASQIGALPPAELPAVAAAAGVDGCMLDTAGKGGTTLLGLMSGRELVAFVEESHRLGLFAALAGSLGFADLPLVYETGVDVVGVRGAACRGGLRRGEVVADEVLRLKNMVINLNKRSDDGCSHGFSGEQKLFQPVGPVAVNDPAADSCGQVAGKKAVHSPVFTQVASGDQGY